jgi:thermolabile hemolysin
MNKPNKNTIMPKNKLASRAAAGLAMAALLVAPFAIDAKPAPFSEIVVFGDSLSDTGNLHRLSGGVPPPPYAAGRFSNGRLWIEYLAEDLGMELLPQNVYAVGGATTGDVNSNDGLAGREYPGLQEQIAAFLSEHPEGADPKALYTLWAGANDFFVVIETGTSPAVLISNGVANTAQALQALFAAGARHIVVPNVPDLGITPFGRGSGIDSAITQLATTYNRTLSAALDALAKAGIHTIRVDAFATLQAMVYSPQQFGFTNVTQPLIATRGDPANFLFWDPVHPTTGGHEVLENEALDWIVEHFAPNIHAAHALTVNALHGLVRAGQKR